MRGYRRWGRKRVVRRDWRVLDLLLRLIREKSGRSHVMLARSS